MVSSSTDPGTALLGVVLDLDGLLIDSEEWSWQAHNAVLVAQGHEPLSQNEVRRLVGLSGREEWLRLLDIRRITVSLEHYAEAQHNAFLRLRDNELTPMPGVEDFLNTVVSCGLRLGLASNSGLSSILDTLLALGIRDRFDAVVSCTDVAHGKPAPDVYLLAMRRLGLRADQTVAVEDSSVGLAAAVAAGLRCLVVPNALTSLQDFSRAHQRFDGLGDASAWLAVEAARKFA